MKLTKDYSAAFHHESCELATAGALKCVKMAIVHVDSTYQYTKRKLLKSTRSALHSPLYLHNRNADTSTDINRRVMMTLNVIR